MGGSRDEYGRTQEGHYLSALNALIVKGVNGLALLEKAVELIEGSVSHVSHGGPTRAEAMEFVKEARAHLEGSDGQRPVSS